MEEIKKIVYKKITAKYPKHDWYRKDNGEIDDMAYEYGYHNGPACKRCDYCFCEHCGDGSLDDGPCVVEEEFYHCPYCKNNLKSIMTFSIIPKDKFHFCPYCGKEIDYNFNI